MGKRIFYPNALYQSIRDTARITGLSQISIRKGCIKGTIPHVKVGREYRVFLPFFTERDHKEGDVNQCV